MSKIQLLDNNLINKIAAGEVVERPLSIVKELVENAIDAKATQITIEIKEGGLALVKVSDNGTGIEKDQVRTAFLRHATSKIQEVSDLEKILTLGFRGEALSSIASVAQVTLMTKTNDNKTGIFIELEGETVTKEEEVACTTGTTIWVRNIFYNVPARRKFLKKAAVEAGYVSELVQKLALGHPDVAFHYIHNGSTLLQTNGNGQLKNVLFEVYGKDVAKKTISIEQEAHGLHLDGFIGKPEIARGNRKYENIFINGRYIKSTLIESAIEEAYKTKLPIGKFPLFVLNLAVDPTTVDVNVHPTKLEVRFSDEQQIYDAVLDIVDMALRSDVLIPEAQWEQKKAPTFQEVTQTVPYKAAEEQHNITDLIYNIEKSTIQFSEVLPESISMEEVATPYLVVEEAPEDIFENITPPPQKKPEMVAPLPKTELEPKATPIQETTIPKEKNFFRNYKIIGQLFNTYWIVEENNSTYIIDQHAAHERILYDELNNQLKNNTVASQRLLQPWVVKLSPQETLVVEENKALLDQFGFELEAFGPDTYAVRSVPFVFSQPENATFFMEIVDKLVDIRTSVKNIFDTKIHAIATISCKAAIKANDQLTYQEARALIEKILQTENPFTCPHGRPTVIEMTKYELERKFKRV